MNEQFEVKVTKVIPAPQKDVFEAWLDPEALARFMLPAEGMSSPKVEVDAREGGSFLIVMKAGDKEMPHRGDYLTIQKYERLSFTWISAYTIPDSTVTLDLKALSPTETELTLTHVGFPNEESCKNHEGGWGKILATLSHVVA